MNSFKFYRLPAGSEVIGDLLTHYAEDALEEDILQVRLPQGEVIDVGWHPAYDRENGSFLVTAYKGDWENQIAQYRVKTEFEVFETVQKVAAQLLQRLAPLRQQKTHEMNISWQSLGGSRRVTNYEVTA